MGELSYVTSSRPRKRKGPVARARAAKRRKTISAETKTKQRVREREGHRCRVCRWDCQSVHEIVPKGAGGEVSMENSIATCGDGVQGCHGFLQRHEIDVKAGNRRRAINANGMLKFTPKTPAAKRWLKERFHGSEFQSIWF